MTPPPAGSDRPDPSLLDPSVYLHERYRARTSRRRLLNAYYAVKPLLPRRVQIAARRAYAKRVHPSFPAWPIEPLLVEHQHAMLRRSLAEQSIERLPLVNFWPDGHRFAVVVTHDVESIPGVLNIEAVLDVERRHGIRSSWNFVAEGYPIPAKTFDTVRRAGGEIGLHGIKHDGRLFRDRASFEAMLPAIRHYLTQWGAVGFRSPALHRNADWMPELGCLYDSSFPDTDPYEPEPGGCCSIFPYFLGELVELPVTMVQDHTLWEILRRPDIELWRRKADWIIANHGLINVIVHPDYVRSRERLESYSQLLEYLRRMADGRSGWHALPREVASWWRARAAMELLSGGDEVRVVDPGAGDWSARARVAWVSERAGALAIDV